MHSSQVNLVGGEFKLLQLEEGNSHLWDRPASAHGLAHVDGALLPSNEPG